MIVLATIALTTLAACVGVAWPLFRQPPAPSGEHADAWLGLAEERDRALGALKELEFDHRTGKVADDEYRRLVGPLRSEAARTLRALEPSRV